MPVKRARIPKQRVGNARTMAAAEANRPNILGRSEKPDTLISKPVRLRQNGRPSGAKPAKSVFGKVARAWRYPNKRFSAEILSKVRAAQALPAVRKKKSLAALGLNPPKKK